ncbi:uncharacterized protein LOC110852485 [Folsomia candida]|nr:uncharacterized protein LOC110852485 [Folsomia candida]
MVFLRGIRSYLASKLRIIISFIIVLLEMWERAITGVLTPADCSHYLAKETDNLATGPSEENEEAVPAAAAVGSSAKRLKRIKLLVDISISPKGSSKVVSVSTKDEIMDEEPPSRWSQLVSTLGLASLHILRAIRHRLIRSVTASPRKRYSQSSSSNGGRITLSPRRRLSQLGRLIPKFNTLFGVRDPMTDSVHLVPQPKMDEAEAANRFAARNQVVEKRKRPESATTDETLYDADECEELPVQLGADGNPAVNNNREVSSEDSDEAGTGCGLNNLESDSASSSQEYSSPSSDLHRLLNIPEEQYESADDEDYVYPTGRISSTDDSTTEDESDPDASLLQQEVLELQADAAAADAELNQEILEALDLEPNVVVGLRDGDTAQNQAVSSGLNESGRSNGEVSVRELTDKPIPPPTVPAGNQADKPSKANEEQEEPLDIDSI